MLDAQRAPPMRRNMPLRVTLLVHHGGIIILLRWKNCLLARSNVQKLASCKCPRNAAVVRSASEVRYSLAIDNCFIFCRVSSASDRKCWSFTSDNREAFNVNVWYRCEKENTSVRYNSSTFPQYTLIAAIMDVAKYIIAGQRLFVSMELIMEDIQACNSLFMTTRIRIIFFAGPFYI